MKSNDPYRARVVAEISIDQAVAAIEHFAEAFPADRCSIYISDRLFDAASKISSKAGEAASLPLTISLIAAPPFINLSPSVPPVYIGGCVSSSYVVPESDATGWLEPEGEPWIDDETLPF